MFFCYAFSEKYELQPKKIDRGGNFGVLFDELVVLFGAGVAVDVADDHHAFGFEFGQQQLEAVVQFGRVVVVDKGEVDRW